MTTVIADWPHLPKQAEVQGKINGARDGYVTFALCRPTSILPASGNGNAAPKRYGPGRGLKAHFALAMERSERSGAKWRFRLASAHDERRGMPLGLQIAAPPLHVGECVPLGREQAYAVSSNPYGPAIVSTLDEEGFRCWSFGHETT